jgi:CheY-like chemotaxis protein
METPERVHHSLDGHAILLVEDNEDDVFMMKRAFRKAHIPNPLHAIGDGVSVLEYLEGQGDYADRTKFPFPLIIFLDLNMPRKGGLEVIEYIRQQPALRKLVINVLSSSTRSADIERAAVLGANAYFIKPTRIEKFQELIENWYNLAKFEAFPAKSQGLSNDGFQSG